METSKELMTDAPYFGKQNGVDLAKGEEFDHDDNGETRWATLWYQEACRMESGKMKSSWKNRLKLGRKRQLNIS